MPSRIDWYLVELDRQLVDFPEERRQILLTEVESHLREQTDEMTAAGMTWIAADAEAVRVFGEPAEFAAKMRHETPLRADGEASLRGTANVICATLAAMVILVAGLGVAFIGHTDYFMGLVPVCGLLVLAGAMTARRITLASMLVCLCLGGLTASVALGVAFVDFGELDGRDVATVGAAQMIQRDPSLGVPTGALPEPGRSQEAAEALAVPVARRALSFLPTGVFAAAMSLPILFLVWTFRHLKRLLRRRPSRAPGAVKGRSC